MHIKVDEDLPAQATQRLRDQGVDTMRFVGQFTAGYGDYTAERNVLFEGMTLDDMIAETKQRRVQTAP
jgi:hypothetical protein